MAKTELAPVRPRRSYPKDLKAQIVAECGQAGVSIAGVALSHGINVNLVHKWIRQSGGCGQQKVSGFLTVTVSAPASRHIEIRLMRGFVQTTVQQPVSEAGARVAWLRERLK